MITKDQMPSVIQDYNSGMSIRQVALKYNSNYGTIRNRLMQYGANIHSRRKYTMNQSFFEKIDSHEKAQILGFYWADGCVLDKTASHYMERLTLVIHVKDLDYMEWIKKQFEATYPIYHIVNKRGEYIRLGITDQKPITDVQRLGLHPRKSLVIGFPSLEQVPAEFIPSFVLGVFEGDGCIHLKKNGSSGAGALVQFAATINFNKSLQQILAEKGIESNLEYPKKSMGKNFCSLVIVKKESIFKIMDWMYRGSSFRMMRKWNLFVEFRARYDANGDFIVTPERAEERRIKLAKVRALWVTTDETKRKISDAHKRILHPLSVSFYAKSPDGTIYHANTISDFAREMNVNVGCFHNFVRQRGTCHTYKKWTIPTPAEIESARVAGTLIEKIYRNSVKSVPKSV
jgi:hypothetical protein